MKKHVLGSILLSMAAVGCSTMGEAADGPETTSPPAAASGSGEVVLLTHESFSLPKRLIREFEDTSGYQLTVRSSGDAGALATALSLTAGNPTGDVAFGIDNTFASRPIGEEAFASYQPTLPDGAEEFVLTEGAEKLTPVDVANVCVNVDTTWFEGKGIGPPQTLEDLTNEQYAGLFVTPAATTSSPGMAFLLATIAEYGEDWPTYWQRLMANDLRIVDGWSDAYYTDFTVSGGDRPIVVSYDSSPAFTVPESGTQSSTRALLDTCFQQVEYAGVLEGADNPAGARAVIDFLLTDEVQSALPESMYVFPVAEVELPKDWARYAEQPRDAYRIDPADIAEKREQWLAEWTDITSR